MTGEMSYITFLKKIAVQLISDEQPKNISRASLELINKLIKRYEEMIVVKSFELKGDMKTISAKNIQDAMREILTDNLYDHAVAEGVKAHAKFINGSNFAKSAGLAIPINRVSKEFKRIIREQLGKDIRIKAEVPNYLSAVLEYLAAEHLDLTILASGEMKTILPRHVYHAIANDSELKELYLSAGYDESELSQENKKSKKSSSKSSAKNKKTKPISFTKGATPEQVYQKLYEGLKKLGYAKKKVYVDETDGEKFNPYIRMEIVDETGKKQGADYWDIDELKDYFKEGYKADNYLPVGYTDLDYYYSQVDGSPLEGAWRTTLVVKNM